MRQPAIVVHMAQRQWVPQLDFVFAQRVDPTADRCDMLAKVEIEALDKCGVDLPPPLGQDRLDGLACAAHAAVLGPNNASTQRGFDDLGIEELRE